MTSLFAGSHVLRSPSSDASYTKTGKTTSGLSSIRCRQVPSREMTLLCDQMVSSLRMHSSVDMERSDAWSTLVPLCNTLGLVIFMAITSGSRGMPKRSRPRSMTARDFTMTPGWSLLVPPEPRDLIGQIGQLVEEGRKEVQLLLGRWNMAEDRQDARLSYLSTALESSCPVSVTELSVEASLLEPDRLIAMAVPWG